MNYVFCFTMKGRNKLFVYELSENPLGAFAINSQTGQIMVVRPQVIDREKNNTIFIKVYSFLQWVKKIMSILKIHLLLLLLILSLLLLLNLFLLLLLLMLLLLLLVLLLLLLMLLLLYTPLSAAAFSPLNCIIS